MAEERSNNRKYIKGILFNPEGLIGAFVVQSNGVIRSIRQAVKRSKLKYKKYYYE